MSFVDGWVLSCSACPMTGPSQYIFKMTVPSSYTLKVAFTIGRVSPVLVVLLHTTSLPVMPSFPPPETKYIDSTLTKADS